MAQSQRLAFLSVERRLIRAPQSVIAACAFAATQVGIGVLASALIFSLLSSSASAATFFWDINGATAGAGGPTPSGTWVPGSSTIWSTSSAGTAATGAVTTGVADDLTFSAGTDATGAYAITVSGIEQAHLITLEDGTVTFSGGTAINLNSGGGITVTSAATGTETFSTPITLGTASLTAEAFAFTNNSSTESLSIGAISASLSGTKTLTITGTGTTMMSGVVGDGAGVVAIVKNGSGLLTLPSNNTFTGGITINSGTVSVTNPGSLNSTNPNAVTFGPGSTGTLSINTTITVSSLNTDPTVGTPTVGASGPGSFATLTVNNSGNSVYGGLLTDAGGSFKLIKSGAGSLTLNGANTFTGGVTINAGALLLGNPLALGNSQNAVSFGANSIGTLTLNGFSTTITGLTTSVPPGLPFVQNANATPASLTVNNAVANFFGGNLQDGVGGGALSLVKSGSGSLTLSGSNTFSGGVTINAGNLIEGVGSVLGSGPVAFGAASTGTLSLNGNATNISGLTTNATPGNPVIQDANANGAQLTVTVASGTNTFAGGFQDGAGGGTLKVVKSGGGTLNLSGGISSSGGVAVNAGTLILSGSSATINGGITINGGTLQVGSSTGLGATVGATVAFGNSSTGILSLNSFSTTITGLTSGSPVGTAIVQNASATPAILTVSLTASPNTFGGVIQDGPGGGALALKKIGSSSLVLTGNNTFTGGVNISNGNLTVGNPGALNSGFANSLTFGAPFTATLTLNGNNVTVGSLSAPATASTIQNASSIPAALTVNSSSIDVVSATLQDGAGGGALSLVKSGSGVLALTGNNTFTGTVTINAGTLNPSGPNALNSTTPVTVNFGPASTGALRLSGVTTVGGLNTDANLGTPSIDNATASPATLVVNNALASVFNGVIAENGAGQISLIKSGAGTLTLGGSNSFTGPVTINTGILQMGNANALNAANGVSFGPGSSGILALNGFSVTIGGLATDADVAGSTVVRNGSATTASTLTLNTTTDFVYAGSIQNGGAATLSVIKTGPGTQTFSGTNFYTGTTTVSAGTLAMTAGLLASNVLNQSSFAYSGGTFGGRLTNAGTLTLNADFVAGNGIENDSTITIPAGRTVTANGNGLDNEGALTLAGGTLVLGQFGAHVNRGTFNLSNLQPFNLGAANLTNNGTLNLNGGLLSGSTGVLTNGFGGTIVGPGTIQSALSNTGGLIAVGAGTTNIIPSFSNAGAIQLAAFNANLTGGAITNTGSIQGFGNLGNSVTNSGIVEAIGGTFFVTGPITNGAAGMLTADAGAKLLITQGLATNAGIVNATGGIFDNNLHALNNTGQISGWGIFRTGGTGLDNNGSITFSGGQTTVNGPVTNEGGKVITVAQNNAIFTGMVTNNMNATFTAVNATATFAGGFTNNGSSNFAKAGGGAVEVTAAPTLNNNSTLSITAGTMKFNIISGTPTIGTGVTATVAAGATLELAGSISALSAGANRVDITNDSSNSGILVSGKNQQVGAIDGAGTTHVNAGSDLTANHIVQATLIIGGTSLNSGLVTITASDDLGNPLIRAGAATTQLGLSNPAETSQDLATGFGAVASSPLRFDPSRAQLATLDLGSFSAGTGLARGFSASVAVPEPASIILSAIAVAFALARVFRHKAKNG